MIARIGFEDGHSIIVEFGSEYMEVQDCEDYAVSTARYLREQLPAGYRPVRLGNCTPPNVKIPRVKTADQQRALMKDLRDRAEYQIMIAKSTDPF